MNLEQARKVIADAERQRFIDSFQEPMPLTLTLCPITGRSVVATIILNPNGTWTMS